MWINCKSIVEVLIVLIHVVVADCCNQMAQSRGHSRKSGIYHGGSLVEPFAPF